MGADGGVDKQFFFELACEGHFGGFAGFDLATGELPLAGECFAGAALGGEDGAVSDDDGAGDGDRCGHRTDIKGAGRRVASQRQIDSRYCGVNRCFKSDGCGHGSFESIPRVCRTSLESDAIYDAGQEKT